MAVLTGATGAASVVFATAAPIYSPRLTFPPRSLPGRFSLRRRFPATTATGDRGERAERAASG